MAKHPILSVANPALASELQKNEYGCADSLTAGTNIRVPWKCTTVSETPCGHEWEDVVYNRYVLARGCPYCRGLQNGRQKTLHSDGRNSMRNTHPDLAAELLTNEHGNADTLQAGTAHSLPWKCSTVSETPCGNEWNSTGGNRIKGNGCPYCGGKALHSDGRNSMRNTHPDLAAELLTNEYGTADTLLAGSNWPLPWRCTTVSETPCGHEWEASGTSRSGGYRSCPSCSGKEVHMDCRNSMRNTHPDLASELLNNKYGTADTLQAVTSKKLPWRCTTVSENPCGHEWSAPGRTRSIVGKGCPRCIRGGLRIDGANSLQTRFPDVAEELVRNDVASASELLPSSMLKIQWRCTTVSETPCGNLWEAVVYSRTSNNPNGCPSCSGRAVHSDGRNSMRNTHPDLAAELLTNQHGTADSLRAGTSKRLPWRCTTVSENPCGYEWTQTGSHRFAGVGCPRCAKYGIHPDKPGIFYVHELLDSDGTRFCFKGGISNREWKGRFREERNSLRKEYPEMSIRHIEYIGFEFARDAQALESRLRALPDRPSLNFDGGVKELWWSNPVRLAIEHGWLESDVQRIRDTTV